ncbi:hypothetical protein ACH5RR_015995 [Cinchona calisaya]|uniref:Pentatricopeptide repeat-containing protein n=1 Tax=Cinchona calisaya TaxID=153742 RepID=A0ABD2ZUR7_9GENT
MESRDIVSWNTMITGIVVYGYHEKAFCLMRQMQEAKTRTLAKGKEIRAYSIKNALASDVTIGSALVDMDAMWLPIFGKKGF